MSRASGKLIALLAILLPALLLASCGGGSSVSGALPPANTPPAGSTPAAPTVEASHVVLVVLENQNYATVVGSASAPYLNSLISQGALAPHYYANVHPSIGNYFMLTAGAMASTNDSYAGTVSPPEMASVLTAAGKSWRIYVEGVSAVGYTGGDTGSYLKRHNPFSYFTDVAGTSAAQNLVLFPQLAKDAASGLPSFSMLVGSRYDVGHDCLPTVSVCSDAVRLQQADAWLKSTLPQILANPGFSQSGLLAITFDESSTDNAEGGGQVMTLLLGTNVKAGYMATGSYQHQSLLRLMLEAQGLTSLPGASAGAASMDEIWK